MKLCDTCIYRNNVEQLKPCIIYRDDCEYYKKEKDDMKAIIQIDVPDHQIGQEVRCYFKDSMYIKGVCEAERTGHWTCLDYQKGKFECSECHTQGYVDTCMYKPIWEFCPRCGADMRGDTDATDN